MSQKILGFAFVLVVGTVLLTNTPVQSQDDKRTTSWRHLALSTKGKNNEEVARNINKLGTEGWELVDVENFSSAGETVNTVYYFKKPE